MSLRRRVSAAVAALSFLLTVLLPAGWAAGASHGAAASAGTVETLAGPGFCAGSATRTNASAATWALAVDKDGRVFFDTGPEGSGLVGRVDTFGRTKLLVTGTPRGRDPGHDSAPGFVGAPVASRMVPDGAGGVFIASGATIVQVSSDNALTTIAGDPAASRADFGSNSSGDGGPASAARFTSARSLASDAAGNLVVVDVVDPPTATLRVRFLNRSPTTVTLYAGTPQEVAVPPGHIDTIAGAGRGPGGNPSPARDATLRSLYPALAVAGDRLYIASSVTDRSSSQVTTTVRLVNLGGAPITAHGVTIPAGNVETVAGGGADDDPRAGGGGAARSVALDVLPGIAADEQGNLYLADPTRHRIRRVDKAGRITTFAGAGTTKPDEGGFDGNNRPARLARLNRPYDVKLGPSGVYISDQANGQVRVVDEAGVIRAVPGSGLVPATVCGPRRASGQKEPAPEVEAPRPGAPTGIVAGDEGDAFFVSADLREVKRVLPDGSIATVAGRASATRSCPWGVDCREPGGDGGPATAALLQRPTALALAAGGRLYVLDAAARRVRLVNLGLAPLAIHGVTVAPGQIATVAGDGTRGAGGDGGPAVEAQLGGAKLSDDTSALTTQLNLVDRLDLGSLAADGDGNLFIADPVNGRVRQVDISGTITTVLGAGAQAPFSGCCRDPVAVVADAAGNLYVSDRGIDERFEPHPKVWFLNRGTTPASVAGQSVAPGSVQVVVGNGTVGFAGDGGSALDAQLLGPSALALDDRGSLYLAEVGEASIDEGSQYVGRIGYVRVVDRAGTIGSIAGDGTGGFNGDGLRPKLTSLNFPTGLSVDRCGNLLVADLGNDRVRRVNLAEHCHPAKSLGPATRRAVSRPVMVALAISVGALGLLGGHRLVGRRPVQPKPTQ